MWQVRIAESDGKPMTLRNLCLIIITVSFLSVGIEIVQTLSDLRRILSSSSADLHALLLPTQKAEGSIASASRAIAEVTAKERDAFAAQQGYYQKLSSDTDAILERFNDIILPRMAGALDHSDAAMDSLGDSVRVLAARGGDSLGRVGPLVDALTARVQDPRYDEILSNASASMTSLNTSLVNTQAVTADARKLADYEYAQITKPVRKVEAVAHVAVRSVGWFLGF